MQPLTLSQQCEEGQAYREWVEMFWSMKEDLDLQTRHRSSLLRMNPRPDLLILRQSFLAQKAAKEAVEEALSVVAEAMLNIRNSVFTDMDLIDENEPGSISVFRGTGLGRIVMDPDNPGSRIIYHEPGIYPGWQCFSGPNDRTIAVTAATDHLVGMSITHRHPILIKLSLNERLFEALRRNGKIAPPARPDETRVSDEYLANEAVVQIFDASALRSSAPTPSASLS